MEFRVLKGFSRGLEFRIGFRGLGVEGFTVLGFRCLHELFKWVYRVHMQRCFYRFIVQTGFQVQGFGVFMELGIL